MSKSVTDLHPQTTLATADVGDDPGFGAVAPPIHLSTSYAWDDPREKPVYDYARSGNPSRTALQNALAKAEGAAGCVVTGSGMSAVDLPLCLVKPGERVIVPHDCYGGTYRLLCARAEQTGLDVEFVDQTDDAAFAAALAKGAKLVMLETPSNPLLRIVDVKARAAASKAAGALVVADNTFLSPALQNPLALGCDIVVHSTTKYINGHSDVIGGAVMAATPELAEQLAWWANCTGVTGPAFDSYLTLRGLRTLYPRITAQQASAGVLCETLHGDERVANVLYPGLPSHPGHTIAAEQQHGFGAMFSVELADGVDPIAFVKALNLFTLAESLGGFESLVCVPATMTHASMSAQARATAGISDSLIRFSVGLEHVDDLLRDIDQALGVAAQQRTGTPATVTA